jgi:hypothetical protein
MKAFWGHVGQGYNSSVSKKRLCFSFFIKSSLSPYGNFQDTDKMLRHCIRLYYLMYLHTNDMESREEVEEKQKKHITMLEIKCVGMRPYLVNF